VVVLGCSHYLLLGDKRTELALWQVTFIDSAASMFLADIAQQPIGTSRPSGRFRGHFRLELTIGRIPEPVWNDVVTALRSQSLSIP
jgi:hypothetical protein